MVGAVLVEEARNTHRAEVHVFAVRALVPYAFYGLRYVLALLAITINSDMFNGVL